MATLNIERTQVHIMIFFFIYFFLSLHSMLFELLPYCFSFIMNCYY